MQRQTLGALRWLSLGLLTVLSMTTVLWLVLQWVILPRMESWRPALERHVSATLGRPVRIGAIEVLDRGLGWTGAVELQQVVLLEPGSGREALRLPRVQAMFSPTSLLPGWDGVWRLRFRQLLIDAPELQIRRDAAGRFSVAGLEIGAASDGGEALADWFFSLPEFAVRGGRVVWSDALRDAPPLTLSAVDLVVRSGVRRHAIRLDATPPAEWGGRFSLRGQFTQALLAPLRLGAGEATPAARRLLARPGDWRHWRGTVYAEGLDLDFAPLQRHAALPMAPVQGRGALRAWIDVQDGEPWGLTADLRLRDLSLPLGEGPAALALSRLEGRLALRREAAARGAETRWSAELRQLAFATADGLDWPATDARLAWRLAGDGALAGGELSAARLDLSLVGPALARLPPAWAGAGLEARLAELGVRGEALGLESSWSGPLEAPTRYQVKVRLQGLGLAAGALAPARAGMLPDPARPGLQGAEVELSATEAGGEARLTLREGAVDFPGVFAQSRIALDELDTTLNWRIGPHEQGGASRIDLRLNDLRFANADAQGRFDLRWSRAAAAPPGALGVVDLSGSFSRGDAAQVPRYLPLVVGPGVRSYLERALLAGRATGASFRLSGDLDDFPFAKAAPPASPASPAASARPRGAGEFRVAVQFEGVRLDFLPADPGTMPRYPWPVINDVQGEVVFERESLRLRKLSGRLGGLGSGGLELRGVEGGIRDLAASDPVLTLDGGVRGPLGDGLRFVQTTPVGGWLGDVLAQAAATGGAQPPIDLKLGLVIPLNDGNRTQVRGTVQLAGNDLRLRPDLPLLAAARARIGFTENSFTLGQGSARVLGGEAQFEGALPPDGNLRLSVQGSASAEGLRRTAELGPAARAAGLLGGQTTYRLALQLARGQPQPEWQFSSSLAGLAVDLPAPLGKPAEPAMALRVQSSAQPAAGRGALPRDLLRIELGAEGARLLQADYLREQAAGGVRVLQGSIAIGTGAAPLKALAFAPAPAEGVSARLEVAQLDLSAWQQALERLGGEGAGATAPPAVDSAYLPATLKLRADELRAAGHRLTRVNADLARPADGGPWKLEIDAAELAGRAEYRPPGARTGEPGGSVVARLTRVSLPRGEDEAVSAALDRAPAASVPALDIVVEDFELRGKRLGRLEIVAENRPPGPGPSAAPADATAGEWQLKRFRLTTPEAQLAATGRWAAPARAGGPRRTQLDFQLDISDGGALLTRLGEAELVRGAKGRIAGQVDWLGSPLAIDYPSLGGQLTVDFDRGQFLQADPGMAKLLGVLSLQSLPRRLLLDFRDVFAQGFAFDTLAGDVKLAGGVAQTQNLRLRGVPAVVLMEGSADVARETQDLRVWIVPEVNAGAASLAYLAINPAVGIGSFLAQLFLRRPLAEAGTREFHVTGPWAAPQVEQMERAERRSPDADPAPRPPPRPPITEEKLP